MSVTVTTARVRAKAGLTDTSFDTAIADLIAEQVPAIEATLIGVYGPEADLGATEIVAAELMDQLNRQGREVQIGELSIGVESSDALRAQGMARLAPYRKDAGAVRAIGPRVSLE
ncbi:hypothetical protein EON82_13025 [bacterium]|nr:MAG: hypothetical protein EON82_13025 [bacterium]